MKKAIHLSAILACAATMTLASCSSDEPAMSGQDPVPEGMARVSIQPMLPVQGRGGAVIATTANLKDFDYIVTFTTPAGTRPMKGRYDAVTNKIYSSTSSSAGSTDLYVPINSVFTITAIAAGGDNTTNKATGGLIDYSPAETGDKNLATASSNVAPAVKDYILGTSASVTASARTVTVPITLNHQTSKITFSAEVRSDADYMVAINPSVTMYSAASAWSVNNSTGAFSHTANSNGEFPFYVKPWKSSNVGSTDCFTLPTGVSINDMVVLCNKDGAHNLMFGDSDGDFTLSSVGARENARQVFWWPGSYSQFTGFDASSASSFTFAGGCGIKLDYQVYHCVYVNGAAQYDGAPFGGTVYLPLDLTGSHALEAGKSYNFKIRFMDDPYDATKVTITPTVTPWDEPGVNASFTGNGWTGNQMPSHGI